VSIVQCTTLGRLGRWGNQLFQYAFVKKYALTVGAQLEIPPWLGEDLFGMEERRISRPLVRTAMDEIPWGRTDVDLFGYFQTQECLDLLSRRELRRWFTLRGGFPHLFAKRSPFYVACHLRRSDYQTHYSDRYCVVARESYVQQLTKLGIDDSDVIWVSADGGGGTNGFLRRYGVQFLEDFYTLVNADVLLRANSTFSWWAGVLGNGTVWSPVVEDLTGEQTVEFAEGNHPKFYHPRNVPGSKHSDLYLPE